MKSAAQLVSECFSTNICPILKLDNAKCPWQDGCDHVTVKDWLAWIKQNPEEAKEILTN